MTAVTRVCTIAFYNAKGGVGATSLVFHLAWMFAELGVKTLAVDCDPQSGLTEAFLDENTRETILSEPQAKTLARLLAPQPATPHGDVTLNDRLKLLPGDLDLATVEVASLDVVIQQEAQRLGVELVLLDLAPNLGDLHRAALLASDYAIVPVRPARDAIQGMRLALREIRSVGQAHAHDIYPIGYVLLQEPRRLDRESTAAVWLRALPNAFRLEAYRGDWWPDGILSRARTADDGSHCLATLRHHPGLTSTALEQHKPIFTLTASDGAVGAYAKTVADTYAAYKTLASEIANRMEFSLT